MFFVVHNDGGIIFNRLFKTEAGGCVSKRAVTEELQNIFEVNLSLENEYVKKVLNFYSSYKDQ